ncbi:hypothetical protein LOTGIDRAFT_231921 [Lottia gigantea]|uniref:Vezatin n=1 Tax=Lottia gigantea TaxID=225164 RepID=V4APX8_LOTGI|nr:hypothetical protein LOTGIDRAFT_231921 [Lottia gigantea]ESO95701.1 hypothetical protein LOTGIDRAFT_231921 [Lottia gigantea]
MNGDSDEDVIFENSPLYKHLQKAGMADITAETINHIKPNVISKPVLKQVDYASLFIDILGKFYQSIVFYCSKTKWGTENLEAWYHMTTIKHVQNSKALEEEDLAFLENYINCNKQETILTEPTVYDCFTKWNGPINYLSTGFLVYTLIWCTGIFPMNLRPMADFLAVAFGVCIMITCFDVCFYWWKRRIFMDTATAIEKCIKTSEKVLHLTRQSLRLIQETELVARGFTLVSQRVAVSGLEQQSSSKLCTELRKTTFYTARSGLLTFREATLKLLELHPLIPEVDSVCNYLASVPLSDYGPCLQLIGQQADNSLHLSQLTDGFSVAALRGMNQLFALYLSEFIRRLTLCFIHDAQIQGSPAPFDKLGSLMEDLFVKLEKEQTKLQKSYDFHRSSPLNREPSKFKFKKSKSKTGDFHTAVHSLELHLQAALVRTQELSLKLEKDLEDEINQTEDSVDLPGINKEEKDNWLHVMKEVKGEIEACKGCWEEGMGRLEKSKDKTVPKLESFFCEIKEKKDQEVNIVDIGEYIIEDQVFEGYTDPDENEDSTWSWEPVLSAEEKEKRKREKEEAKRLLSELRSVISVRAEDRERREKVAIEKAKGHNSHSVENAFDITIKKQRLAEGSLNDEFESGPKMVEEVAEIKMYVTEKAVDPDLALSNSDVFSSTKADSSALCLDHVSSLENISPIASKAESSRVLDDEPLKQETSSVNEASNPKDVLRQNNENLNNSACYNKIHKIEDTFASISALDENKLSNLQSETDISTNENHSDSEFSSTSSKDVSYSQSSIDIDSSSCKEDSILKSANSSKSSSGFFDGKDHARKPDNSRIPNQKNNATYSISPKNFSKSQTNLISSPKCDNTDTESLVDPNLSQPLNTLTGLNHKTVSNCDNKHPDASSSFFTPTKNFSGNISGVAPLDDSKLESTSSIYQNDDLSETLPNEMNTPMITETASKSESFQRNQRSPLHGVSDDQSTPGSQRSSSSIPKTDLSIIETQSQSFLGQSTGFDVEDDTTHAMKDTEASTEDSANATFETGTPSKESRKSKYDQKTTFECKANEKNQAMNDTNSTYETGTSSKDSTNNEDVQEMTFEHDPDLEADDNALVDSSDPSLDGISPDTSSSSTGETGPTDLDIRISRLPGANLAFSANIAAMAAARSVNLNLNIDTFGDSSSDGECQCSCECEGECEENEK